jgi:hypothetical protein
MVFTFGGNGFFGYGYSGLSLMWWSTYETSTAPDRKAISVEEIRTELRKRHGHWKDPIIHREYKPPEPMHIPTSR